MVSRTFTISLMKFVSRLWGGLGLLRQLWSRQYFYLDYLLTRMRPREKEIEYKNEPLMDKCSCSLNEVPIF